MKLFYAIWLLFFHSCTYVENELNKKLIPKFGADSILDQGIIHFDNVGNITVEMNNLEFRKNPLYSPLSYIGVWVYRRGADPLSNCCSGSSKDCGLQANSCLLGVGFSNDLGFLGPNYINRVPPRPFNQEADKYYMPVYVSESKAIPRDYQGEYTLFSATTNPVADRSQFDLYMGVFYNVINPRTARPRAINDEAQIGNRKYFTRVDPDWLSPKIEIESRFFPQTREDPAGSTYSIPHMLTWNRLPELDRDLDKRGRVRINEIGSFINNQTANDFIEIYNPSNEDVILDDVFIQKYTPANCITFKETSSKEDLTGVKIKAKSFYTLSRVGSTLPNINKSFKEITVGDEDCFALTKGAKSISIPIESEDPNTEGASIQGGRETLTDPKIIDFVGLEDKERKNNWFGNNPAPRLIGSRGSAVSRCPNGIDTRDNGVDFTYQTPSPGVSNSCVEATSINTLQAGEVVISEVSVRNNISGCVDGDDDFIEIQNRSGKTVNVAGAKLYYITSTGTVSEYFQFESFVLANNQTLAVVSKDSGCFNSSTLAGRNVLFKTITSSAFNLSSTGASIILTRNGNTFPLTQTGPAANQGLTIVLDNIGYGDANVYENLQSNVIENYSISRCNSVDENNNALDFQLERNTVGLLNSCGTAKQVAGSISGELVISEVHANADTTTGFEGGASTPNCISGDDDFVEIYNPSSRAINLAGARLLEFGSTGNISDTFNFGYTIIEPNSYLVMISKDSGCYTSASMAGRNFVFKGGAGGFDISSAGSTIALFRNTFTVPTPQFGPQLNSGSSFALDYIGYCGNAACAASNSVVFETARAPHCNSSSATALRTSRIRTNPNIDTNNNSTDFSCGNKNGRPGVAN